MRILISYDSNDYEPHWPVYRRDSVRGIVLQQDKLLMIHSRKYGDFKFPGGGIENSESHADALVRETREETGLTIAPGSMREYGEVLIRRKSSFEKDTVFQQTSFYYFCDLEGCAPAPLKLDDWEADYGYHPVYITPREALAHNSRLPFRPETPWLQRETDVLNLLVEELT